MPRNYQKRCGHLKKASWPGKNNKHTLSLLYLFNVISSTSLFLSLYLLLTFSLSLSVCLSLQSLSHSFYSSLSLSLYPPISLSLFIRSDRYICVCLSLSLPLSFSLTILSPMVIHLKY